MISEPSKPEKKLKLEKLPKPDDNPARVHLVLKRNCGNCYFGRNFVNSPHVECHVDLPPFVLRSSDPKKYKVHKTYSCFAHRWDKTKEQST